MNIHWVKLRDSGDKLMHTYRERRSQYVCSLGWSELTMQTKQASNSHISTCLLVLSAGIQAMCYHAWLFIFLPVFHLLILQTDMKGVLRYPTSRLDLCSSAFNSMSFCVSCFLFLLLDMFTLGDDMTLVHHLLSSYTVFILGSIPYSKDTFLVSI